MLRITFFIALTSLLFISCGKDDNRPLLSPDNLESWKFKVDANTDMVFKTPKGALLKIEKGTFDREVELEVKEAYTMRDILLGGLSTTSNGRPLSSGGMIYLNAADESELQILKPIQVALPTTFVNTDMQVFQGELDGDSINWINPDTLPDSEIKVAIEMGKQIFQQNCATCHAIDRDGTGPALRGFRERGPWSSNQALRNWVHDPTAFMNTNKYAKDLRDQYGVIMQSFPSLEDFAIDAIAAYIENEENNFYPDTSAVTVDSMAICADTIAIPGQREDARPPGLDPEIFEQDTIPAETGDIKAKPLPTGAYVFMITSPGWYNVDILVEELPGAVPCDVEIKTSVLDSTLTVNLLLPKLRINIPGKFVNGVFVFDKIYNQNEFVPGTEAVVIAFSNEQDEFYYGAMSFSMSPKVSLILTLKKGNKEDFEKLLKEKKLDRKDESVHQEEDDDVVIEEAFEAIDNDQRRDSVKIISYPCDQRPGTDSISYIEWDIESR